MQRRTLVALNETGARIGEHHPRARLTQADVNRLLDLRAAGWSLGQLAKLFRVSKGAVQHVCSGVCWTQKPARYRATSIDVVHQPVALDLTGIPPTLGRTRAVPAQQADVDWPRPAPDPLPSLPPLIDGQESGERVTMLIAWTLLRTTAVAVAAPCAEAKSALPQVAHWGNVPTRFSSC